MGSMELFDTHCHLHELVRKLTPVYDKWRSDGVERTPESVIAAAHEAGVRYMLCVGTSLADSELAIEFVQNRADMWASIGIHPHEASQHLGREAKERFAALATAPKVVAIGECGLDYFYNHSPKAAQIELLKFQIELALEHNLPMSFHVREAFDDFWPIYESYGVNIPGVLHSYTDSLENLERALGHGLYIGVNGIVTFARDEQKRVIYRTIPQRSLLFETDAPFLTPVPYRGNICEPKHTRVTAEFVSALRTEPLEQIIAATTKNARTLFKTES